MGCGRLVAIGAVVAVLAACGQIVQAASPAQARQKGAVTCRPLHKNLEAIAWRGSLYGSATPRSTRGLLIGTLINAVRNYPGYRDARDLGYEFAGCVGTAWSADLGSKPAVPKPWR